MRLTRGQTAALRALAGTPDGIRGRAGNIAALEGLYRLGLATLIRPGVYGLTEAGAAEATRRGIPVHRLCRSHWEKEFVP